MSFGGFDLAGARRVEVTSWTLGGARRTEVLSCVVEVTYDEGTVERTILLEPDTMNLGAFQAFIRALNQRLAG
ncbi:MAG: hypothetical protein M3Y91_17040 [Actinomycetota bacterium]|nr:hypothetical protein [Actinomycetota bacterium]